jgi:LPS-assembly protein
LNPPFPSLLRQNASDKTPNAKPMFCVRIWVSVCVSVCAFFSASSAISAYAQQSTAPSQLELDNALREGKRLDRSIPTPSTLLQRKKEGPRFLEADRLGGVNGKQMWAEGNVELKQDNMTVRAERVDYNQETDMAATTGPVKMTRDGDSISGINLKLHVADQIGSVEKPTFVFGKSASRPTQKFEARASADRMNLEGVDKERLFNAAYTTCKANEDDWYLRVSDLALDRTTNVGTGYNGRVEFKGVPILYVPYLTFPLDNERKSGFLPPSFGSSSKSGLEFSLPYYWNISPDRDATITPKIFTQRGLQLGGEFRYLSNKYVGQLDGEFLPNDNKAGRDRFLASARHFQNLEGLFGVLPPGLSASINAQKVSDDAYFRDLSTRISNTSQTNLPREAALNYVNEFGNASARFLSFQTLQDPALPLQTPYRLAPQISLNANPLRSSGLEFNVTGEFTDFRHPTLVSGRRWLLYPTMSLPLTRSYGYVTPKIGYHITRYDLTDNTTGYEGGTRALPIASVDSSLSFERPLVFANKQMTQTLEPRLYFLYAPFREQSKLPVFSTSESDFNFAQIFNENLFIGGDRVSEAKQLTAALTTRFIENATGIERLRMAIGQRYYYQTQRVGLSSTLPNDSLGVSSNAQGIAQATASRSDLLAAVSGQISDRWSLDSNFQYSASLKEFRKANLATRYTSDEGQIANLSYRFSKSTLEQIDLSTQWPFGRVAPGWTMLARANYSLKDRRILESLVGAEYNQGCWEFRVVAHRFITATQQYSNSIQFQLELKGLSKLGINPLETIRQNIPGYRRAEDKID